MAEIQVIFTEEENNTLFTNQIHGLGLDARTFGFFQAQGFGTVDALFELDEDGINTIFKNASNPVGTEPDPNNPGQQRPIPPFLVTAKSKMRLKAVIKVLQYYCLVNRPITPPLLRWRRVQRFDKEWDIITVKKEEDRPKAPKVDRKTTNLRNYEDYMMQWLNMTIGHVGAKLSYVVRKEANLPNPPPLAEGKPFTEESGSVLTELTTYCRHDHVGFQEDNALVFDALEIGLRGTMFYPVVKPFSKTKDGRAAWMNVLASYLGEDKWRQEIADVEDFLSNRKWKGTGPTPLDTFANKHRQGHHRLASCQGRTDVQLPDGRRKVERFLTAITCSDPDLRAAIAQIKADKTPDGPLHDFEKCVALLLPSCPIAKKRRLNRSNQGKDDLLGVNISATSAGLERTVGESGVELGRYYTSAEYSKLTNEQKNELRLYRIEKGTNKTKQNKKKQGDKKRKNDGNKDPITKKQMKAMMESMVAAVEALKDNKSQEQNGGAINANVSAVAGVVTKDTTETERGLKDPALVKVAAAIGLLKNNAALKGKKKS